MSGCGLGNPSSAQRVATKRWARPCCCKRAGQANARLAGGDGEQKPARVELVEQLARSGEQRDLRIAGQVMVPVALGQPRIVCGRQAWRDVSQGVGEPKADDEACPALVGGWQL